MTTTPQPTDGAVACHCALCDPPIFGTRSYRMVLCATCGNKRCPHATDHRYACTGSNEPGQFRSSYGPAQLGGGVVSDEMVEALADGYQERASELDDAADFHFRASPKGQYHAGMAEAYRQAETELRALGKGGA